ncbi:hypothetical protein GCM10010191_23320 [Actinomadura vinacea]|uniref:Permease n=1 Tax=Actinomadura vinacea TaxID=115336 RepID=A0ABN3IUT2_9ACTN
MERRSCPGCRNPIADPGPACLTCGLPLQGELADGLWRVQREIREAEAALRELDARRARLAEQHADLLRRLREEQHAARVPALPSAAAPAADGRAAPAPPNPAVPLAEPDTRGPRRDLSRYAVQNLLLLLGGLMLGIAAIVFTVVSWGHLSIRAAILATVTAGTLAFPWLLVRRRLHSTAETVAYIGLVFLPLTGVALVNAFAGRSNAPDEMNLPGSENTGLWAAAAVAAAMAAVWAGYARIAPLRLPAPTALALAQAPLPLAALALGPTAAGVALALVLTAAFDLAVWLRADGVPERAVAATAGLVAGAGGTVTAFVASFPAASPEAALRVSAVLVPAALLTAACGWFLKDEVLRGVASCLAGASVVAACAAPLREVVPSSWAVTTYTASACLLLTCIGWTPERLRHGVGTAGAGALTLTVVWVTPQVLVTATAPLTGSVDAAVWNADGALPALGLGTDEVAQIASPGAPFVLGAASLVALALRKRLPSDLAEIVPERVPRAVALVLAASAVLALPAAVDAPYGVAVTVVLGLATVLLAIAAWSRDRVFASVAIGMGVYLALLTFMWPMGDAPLWPVAAAVVTVAFVGLAGPARTPVARAVLAAGAVLSSGALLLVLWDTTGWTPLVLPFVLLGVRLVAMVVVRLTRGRPRALAHVAALAVSSVVVSLLAVGIATGWTLVEGTDSHWPGVLALTLAITALMGAASAYTLRRFRLPRAGSIGESYVFAVLAPLPLSDAFFPALFGPYGWLAKTWAGAGTTESARDLLTPEAAWTVRPMLMPVLALAALAAVCAAGVHRGRWAALGVAQVAVPVVLAPVPLATDLPYWAALAFLVVLTAGLALWAAMHRTASGGTALWTATLAVSWSLADQTATLAVLAALALAGAVCALRGRDSPVASVASAVTTLAVGAEGAAAALAADLPAHHAAFVVLAIAALAVRAGALLEERHHWIAQALNAAALLLWCGALSMTLTHMNQLTLVLALGGLTAVMAAARLRGQARMAVLVYAWLAEGLALLLHLRLLLRAVLKPYAWVGDPWSEASDSLLGAVLPLGAAMAAAATAGIAALTAIASARLLRGARGAYKAGVLAVPPAVLVVPVTADLPYAAGLALVCVLATALAIRASLPRAADWYAGGMALWLTTLAVAWSLLMPLPTLVVAGGIAVLATGCGLTARNEEMRCGASAFAVLAAGGLVAAVVLAGGFRVELAGLAMLAAVAAPTALGAWEIGHRRRGAALAVEFAGYAVAVIGVGLACASVSYAVLALACAGVLFLTIAFREDRRRPALGVGVVLVHLALWLWLADQMVEAPEAYTTTVSLLGLAGGWWLRRRDDRRSSWTAYAPALTLTLVPSLVVAWNDDGLVRPLLLGLVAFAVTLAGAWARLQALLLFGGAVLVVNAAHELYPALADLVGDGPRWLPIALTGAALLFTGATYEHRLRDFRRVRRSIAGMR